MLEGFTIGEDDGGRRRRGRWRDGEVPSDPREGNGSVDCRKVAVILAEVEDGARWLQLVTRKFRNRAKAPAPRSSMKVALAERERWCRRSLI